MKKLLALGLTTILCLTSFANLSHAAIEPKVLIDNKRLESSNPILMNNRTMVQFRPIFEQFDMNVAWDSKTRKVTGEKRGLKIEMTIGKKEVHVTHSKPYYPEEYTALYVLDQPAEILNGRTLVPLRFIAETTNAKVNWDNLSKTASITTAPTYCKNPYVSLEGSLEDYLSDHAFTMIQEENRTLFYDNNFRPDTFMVSFDENNNDRRVFIGFHDNEKYRDLGAEIAVRNGFPIAKDEILNMFENGRAIYDGTCNGVTYTFYVNNGFNIILAWKN